MGILSWLFVKRSDSDEQVPVHENTMVRDLPEFDVVGESHYQTALSDICGGRSEYGQNHLVDAYLVHEDNNKHVLKQLPG